MGLYSEQNRNEKYKYKAKMQYSGIHYKQHVLYTSSLKKYLKQN